MHKLIFTLGVIITGLATGYVIQQLHNRGRITLPVEIARLRKILQMTGLLGVLSVSFFLAVWIIRIPDPRLMAIPFIGLTALVLGGILAVAASRLMGHARRQTGAMFGCGSFTNIGAIGALVCIVFLGEAAFALVALYKLFEETYYYAVAFPITRGFGPLPGGGAGLGARLKRLFSDPFVRTILGAIILGGTLNLAGVPRPGFFSTVNSIIVPLGSFMLLVAIGLGMRLSSLRAYLKEGLAMAAIKFLLIPTVVVSAGLLLGFGHIGGGLPLKVVLVCSSMPVAFNALIPPSIYDLDLDLANACWLVTNLGLVVTLPVLYFVLRAM